MRFVVEDPDDGRSPRTGMARRHWTQAARFILEGAFSHVDSPDGLLLFPKIPGVSYPREGYEHCTDSTFSAAAFEGYARTLNLAAPLIHEDPGTQIGGMRIADYYASQMGRFLDPGDRCFIGESPDPDAAPSQQTCELGNLCLWMQLDPAVLWDRLAPEVQKRWAEVVGGWAHGKTLTHNWRWFNVMMLTWLSRNGFPTDLDLMRSHLDHLLLHHAGDGWYRDAHFDYYTIHVFHLYGILWCRFYGDAHEPARAAAIRRNFRAFLKGYPSLMARDGYVNMWGRSTLYRLAASAGLAVDFFTENPEFDPGFARRLASGSLLQFIGRAEFFENRVPALGFYGGFPPCIQPYSCAASPFWMFLPFVSLMLPEENPFWTATENDGFWTELGASTRSTFLAGPGLLLTSHGATGTAEIRTAQMEGDDPNYNRLAYSTHFPWQAALPDGTVAAHVCLRYDARSDRFLVPSRVTLGGWRDGVLYRQARFYDQGLPAIAEIAEAPLVGGTVVVILLRNVGPYTLRLAHFGLPDLETGGTHSERDESSPWIDNGRWRLRMESLDGWTSSGILDGQGVHPESGGSLTPYLEACDGAAYGAVRLFAAFLSHGPSGVDVPRPRWVAANPSALVFEGRWRVETDHGPAVEIEFGPTDGLPRMESATS